MRKPMLLAAILAAVVFPTASQAQFTLGVRLGFAPAMGDAEKDAPLTDLVKSQVPAQLDALYNITPEIAAGLYVSYGFAQLDSAYETACDQAGADCSVSDLRFGVQGVYTFTQVSPRFVPWAGLGAGYEAITTQVALGGASLTRERTGWEYLNVQVGGDYKLDPKFAVGPYVMLSVGQYSSVEGNSISEKGTHEWLSFGLRGKFDL